MQINDVVLMRLDILDKRVDMLERMISMQMQPMQQQQQQHQQVRQYPFAAPVSAPNVDDQLDATAARILETLERLMSKRGQPDGLSGDAKNDAKSDSALSARRRGTVA